MAGVENELNPDCSPSLDALRRALEQGFAIARSKAYAQMSFAPGATSSYPVINWEDADRNLKAETAALAAAPRDRPDHPYMPAPMHDSGDCFKPLAAGGRCGLAPKAHSAAAPRDERAQGFAEGISAAVRIVEERGSQFESASYLADRFRGLASALRVADEEQARLRRIADAKPSPEKQSPAPTAPAVAATRPTPAGSPNPASAASASLEVEALNALEVAAAQIDAARVLAVAYGAHNSEQAFIKAHADARTFLRKAGRHE